jgi:hypothetical protein
VAAQLMGISLGGPTSLLFHNLLYCQQHSPSRPWSSAMTNPPLELAARITAADHQFASVRQRFDRPGVERGGCPRAGVTPVYVRKFGDHATTIFPNLATVEASFDAEQLHAVTTTLLLLKGWITGHTEHAPLAERILDAYLSHTRPYFVAALLQATEAVLAAFLNAHPDHAPVIDAIFCVAGSEGFRDLVRLYDARALEHAGAATALTFPDILAFVNLHERVIRAADGTWQESRYEVWCPGYDLAKEYHQQCVQAAYALVDQHQIVFVPSLQEEVRMIPENLVTHFTTFVRTKTKELVQEYTKH